MKKKPPVFNELFRNPDMVGTTEYLTIYYAVKTYLENENEGTFDPDVPLNKDQLAIVKGMLEEIISEATGLLKAMP